MVKTLFLGIGLLAGRIAAAPSTNSFRAALLQEQAALEERLQHIDALLQGDTVEADDTANKTRGRELFPLYAVGAKCARRGCSVYNQMSSVNPKMALGESNVVKGPVKTLEMLALNDDLHSIVQSNSFCTRRQAMARAAGLAAGLTMAQVKAPGFAAETKMVKMGSDAGQLIFVPDEISICKGDSVTWVNNKGGPHNVVFDEDAIPSGVSVDAISMDDQLGDEGATFSKKFDVAGSYSYFCEPHRGAGMNAVLTVA